MAHQTAIRSCAAAVICCCAAAAFVYSQSTVASPILGQVQEVFAKGKSELPTPPQSPHQDGYLGVVVTSSKQLDKKLDANVVAELTDKQVSGALLKQFDRVLRNPQFRLAGWSADITNLETDGETSAVTVRYTPIIAPRSGGSVTIVGAVDEVYELKDGKLELLRRIAVGNPSLGRFLQD